MTCLNSTPLRTTPFEVRDDAEMQALVESVKTGGVNQPALVRPREGGGYEIVAGHRRQKASELAGYRNMPCIVRNMTDDEAILTMTDDNLLADGKELASEDIVKAAAEAGICERTVQNAKRNMGGILGARRVGGQWYNFIKKKQPPEPAI